MKKIIAILLILSTLCLTACNNQTVETSTSTSKTEQTENTSTSQTTENIQTSETTATERTTSSTETTSKTDQTEILKVYIPDDLKDQIKISQTAVFFDLQSRIVFSQSEKQVLRGDRFFGTGRGNLLCYYSKADGEFYYNCFDPLCDHSTCPLSGIIWADQMAFYNNRFYEFDLFLGSIESFSFDGTDRKLEYQMFEKSVITSPFGTPNSYGRYWFVSYLHKDETYHCLRFDMETGEMEDLTEETGNYISPSFFYNGEIYGKSLDGTIKKSNLDLTKIEDTDIIFKKGFYYTHAVGSVLIGYIKEWNTNENIPICKGIYAYDIQTGEETFIPSETVGKNVVYTFYADDNYIYFASDDKGEYIGKSRRGSDYYNSGTLYRVNRDGTNCICVFKDSARYIYTRGPLLIYENKIFVYAAEVGVAGGIAQSWNEGMYIGTIQTDGTIDKLEYIEVIE